MRVFVRQIIYEESDIFSEADVQATAEVLVSGIDCFVAGGKNYYGIPQAGCVLPVFSYAHYVTPLHLLQESPVV